jgi:hypothetical protein
MDPELYQLTVDAIKDGRKFGRSENMTAKDRAVSKAAKVCVF